MPIPSSLVPAASPNPGGAGAVVLPGRALPGAPSSPGENDAPAALRLAAAMYRHRWMVLAVTAAGLAAGVAGTRLVEPEYEAQGTVWIEGGDREAAAQGPIREGQLLQSYAWVELLKSYAVLDAAVQDQRLYLQPAKPADADVLGGLRTAGTPAPGRYLARAAGDRVVLEDADGRVLQSVPWGAALGAGRGFAWVPPRALASRAEGVAFTLRNPRDVGRELGDRIETRMAEDGHFLRLSLAGHDPPRLAATLNALMARYVAVAAQLKRAKLDELTGILDQQKSLAEANLRDAEAALQGFRVRTVTLPSERAAPLAPGLEITRDPVFSSYFQMKVSREDVEHDREMLRRVLADAAQGRVSYDALAANAAVQRSPELVQLLADRNARAAELRALRQRATDDHPSVRRAAADLAALEHVAIPRAVNQLDANLAAQASDMDTRIASASQELRAIPTRAIEEARLQRRVEISNTLYGNLRQRYEEARLSAVSTLPDLKVLDRAAPPAVPLKDRRPMVLLGGGAGGLLLALVLVALLERADRRVHFPEQVSGGMGLPVLGTVPYVHLGLEGGATPVEVAEAFRELRLSVTAAYEGPPPVVLTVSSPEAGEGKSTVALRLARAFAEQGHGTVLVDGDIRRGVLHRTVGMRRSPGLTDYLARGIPLSQVIQPLTGGLSLIGSGTRMKNGPELLGSSAMSLLVSELRARFSVVVVDSAPLAAGVDAYVLGAATGSMVLVMRTGATDGALAAAKLEILDRLPIRVLGAVMNAVPRSRIYRSYYAYQPGYAIEPETVSVGPGTQVVRA